MGECSICARPEVAAMVDDWLDLGVFLDDISARLALQVPPILIHRSSIHRHKKKCYSPRARAARLKERESARVSARRIFVEWPTSVLFGELAGKITSSDFDDADAIAPGELREADILLTVTFEERGQKPAQNQAGPSSLKPEELPGETMQNEPEETKSDGLFARLRKLLTGDKSAEQPPAPAQPPPVAQESLEAIQSRCQHDFRTVANTQRCIHCGHQPPVRTIPGISRADYFAARRRF